MPFMLSGQREQTTQTNNTARMWEHLPPCYADCNISGEWMNDKQIMSHDGKLPAHTLWSPWKLVRGPHADSSDIMIILCEHLRLVPRQSSWNSEIRLWGLGKKQLIHANQSNLKGEHLPHAMGSWASRTWSFTVAVGERTLQKWMSAAPLEYAMYAHFRLARLKAWWLQLLSFNALKVTLIVSNIINTHTRHSASAECTDHN